MKFREIFRFELAYQLRRPWPWLFFVIVLVLSFLMTRDGALGRVLYTEFLINSPFAIAKTAVFGGLLWLLVAPPIAGESAARDAATGMHPLVYTTPIGRTTYLAGRFLAALVLNLLILLAVPIAILLAVYLPGVNPVLIGPFRPIAYITAFAFILLPNAVVGTALQFALALRSGRPMASYVASVGLVFMSFFVASLLLFKRALGKLLDPIGVRFIWEDLSHLWTPIEKNVRLLALEGTLLGNRMLWLGVGLATLALTWVSFRFAHRTDAAWWSRWLGGRNAHAPTPALLGIPSGASVAVPHVPRAFGFRAELRKSLAIAGASFRAIARSLPGLAMLVGLPMLTVLVLLDQMSVAGVPLVPTTAWVLRELTGQFSDEMSRWIITPLLIVFFAGELVWREREAGVSEIGDAMPGSDWAPFVGKFLGLGLVLTLFMTLMGAAGITAQLIDGYRNLEIGLYLKALLGLQLSEYLLFAVLALSVHVMVNQKYVGHLAAVLIYVYILVLAGMLGIEHNLLVYLTSPAWSYTEMRGFGPTIGPWLSFKLYWAAWAVVLAVAARLLWVRGRESAFRVRMKQARLRLGGGTAVAAALAAVMVLVLGGFIFYNTNVLNEYLTADEMTDRRAEYEHRYRHYLTAPQPSLAEVSLQVEIHPRRRAAEIRGSYRLVNAGTRSIDSILVSTALGSIETGKLAFDRSAALAAADERHGARVFRLARPLQPGETLRLEFEVRAAARGFRENGADASVVDNGSYFTNTWLPLVGYQRERELIHGADRRDQNLEPRPLLASLYAVEGQEPPSRRGGVTFRAVVGTDGDQVAVAPGALRRSWRNGDRNYFEYATDAPIGMEWAFFSADYAVQEGRAGNVAVRIHHHPAHTAHVDRIMRSVRASLAHYSEQYGPYPYGHLTVVEHGGAPGTGAHADASVISHGEGWAYWSPRNERRLDFPYAVMAHEVAHQWTVPYAMVEGLPFLAEGLAWFFAMQAVRESRGEGELRRLLANMRQPYPFSEIRRGEPLLRALDPYLAYRRGPFAMHALTEYVGRDRVNTALRTLVEKHDAPGAPAATTLDLYRELQAVTPDSLRYLLHDLFEVNTYWRFEAPSARARRTEAGGWEVTLEVRAEKEVFDSAGVKTEVPLNEELEIGIFARAAEGEGELSRPLYLKRHRIRSGTQTIRVQVDAEPVLAGIDPHHVLDWDEDSDDDNITTVVNEP